MTDIGVDLMTFSTGDDLGEVLAYHLRRRAAMKNPHAGDGASVESNDDDADDADEAGST